MGGDVPEDIPVMCLIKYYIPSLPYLCLSYHLAQNPYFIHLSIEISTHYMLNIYSSIALKGTYLEWKTTFKRKTKGKEKDKEYKMIIMTWKTHISNPKTLNSHTSTCWLLTSLRVDHLHIKSKA